MRWIVKTSLQFRYLVVFAAAALMVFGIARLRNSSVDVFPEFAPPKVEIQTLSLGLSAAAESPRLRVWISTLGGANSGKTSTDELRSRAMPKTISAAAAKTTR